MSNQALVVSNRDNWQVLREEATTALKSGFLPQHIKSPEQAIAIAMVGRELGITAWRALTGIKVIQGTPTLSSELMAHLIFREHGGDALVYEESTAETCTISYQRRGAKDRKSYTYTMDMAKRAGLANNANYQKHPENMLRARCTSNVARMAFPDTIAGCYTEDEITGSDAPDPGEEAPFVPDTSQPPLAAKVEDVPTLPSDEDPVTQDAMNRLLAAEEKLFKLTGEVDDADPIQTMGEARARQKQVLSLIAKARAAQASAPNLAMAGVP